LPEVAVKVAPELESLVGAPVAIGTNANFNELNRHRPDPGTASALVWSMNPQVHAFDELSLVENLPAQSETVLTARSFAPGATLHVSPVTLRPRFNAVATTGDDHIRGGVPWNTDPRQSSLFAAVWTLGSVAALTAVGTESVTYYEMVGPRGLIESPRGSVDPDEFCSFPDTAFPLALVLADICGLQGARVLEVDGFDELRIGALAAETATQRTVLVANLTRRDATVELVGVGGSGTIRTLDATTARAAVANPHEFIASGDPWTSSSAALEIRLAPYGSARLDRTYFGENERTP
jgi:hypothetical protein